MNTSLEKTILKRLYEKQLMYERDDALLDIMDPEQHLYQELAKAFATAIRIVNQAVSESNRAEVPGEG